ncbi:MAG TPA: hypothetical protein VKB80_01280 [Kofleriaceae bacterium]|nr:hypothetical protein [Kofleriaceae bacterium]
MPTLGRFNLSQRRDGAGKVAIGRADAFLEQGPALVGDQGVVEVSLTGARDHIDRLVDSSAFQALRAIRLRGLDDAAAERLGSAAMADLRELTLPDSELSVRGVEGLFSGHLAARLERLDLSGNPLDDAGAAALAKVDLSVLVELRLHECRIGKDGAAALAGAALSALREIDLGNQHRPTATPRSNVIGPTGGQALAAAPWIGQIEVLRLAGNEIEDAGARALAAVPLAVRDADLCYNRIGPDGARALASAPWSRLHRIGLTGNQLLHDTETVEIYDFPDSHLGAEKRPLRAAEIAARYGFPDHVRDVY